ncbi:unnamed protein product [Alopecurus aequalis]
MSFAGVSLIRDGKLGPSASAINDAGSASGYHHLLVVEGYSTTKADVLSGNFIQSRSFRVGGFLSSLRYYPNGYSSIYGDFISAALLLAQDVATPVKAKYKFTFTDQADKQDPSHIRAAQVFDFPKKSCGKCNPEFIRRDAFENSEHLKDDKFTIRCDIIVKDVDATGSTVPFVTVPPPDMQQHFADLLMTKEGADVTFNVGGETFPAHRCVLLARSRVFKDALFGPMKEGSMANAGVINLKDMDARAFRAMLTFIYSDSEPDLGKEDNEDAMWQQLLVAADMYDLQRLKLMCEDKLCRFIDVNTMTAILDLAERHSCDGLKKACYDFIGVSANLKAVAATDGFHHLVSTYPSVMKELIAMLAP